MKYSKEDTIKFFFKIFWVAFIRWNQLNKSSTQYLSILISLPLSTSDLEVGNANRYIKVQILWERRVWVISAYVIPAVIFITVFTVWSYNPIIEILANVNWVKQFPSVDLYICIWNSNHTSIHFSLLFLQASKISELSLGSILETMTKIFSF